MSAFGHTNEEMDVWFSNRGSDTFGTVGMFVGDMSMFGHFAFVKSKHSLKIN
jgi:hypothetical protein